MNLHFLSILASARIKRSLLQHRALRAHSESVTPSGGSPLAMDADILLVVRRSTHRHLPGRACPSRHATGFGHRAFRPRCDKGPSVRLASRPILHRCSSLILIPSRGRGVESVGSIVSHEVGRSVGRSQGNVCVIVLIPRTTMAVVPSSPG